LARSPALTIDRNIAAAIAATRFGLGARAGEIERASADPQAFLTAQIRPHGAEPTQPNPPLLADRMRDYFAYKLDRARDKQDGTPKSPTALAAHRELRDDTAADFLARVQLGATTPDGFRERWALFWANHFTVSAAKVRTATLMGPFEDEAIRPHVFGRFEDLLLASSTHPAMLYYLDQSRSIGPESPAAKIQAQGGKHTGLNENLAREILELHTVGLEAGYAQSDVTEFARAMTGWTVDGDRDGPDQVGRFVFHERTHQPGARTIMGKRYPDGGVEQARAVMRDLAASPHTAHHIALKLARHFVADDPPPALVDRLRRAYLDTGGDLGAVARGLVAAPEAWDPAPAKFKTPYEFLVSAWRATDVTPGDIKTVSPVLTAMGQKPFEPPSPKGWAEEAEVWCAPDAVIKRMNWSETFAPEACGERDPMALARNALGARLTAPVATTIARAETRGEGLAILLMSPEFQRR
jgi:uncharacterized protein (DUF1800 family)